MHHDKLFSLDCITCKESTFLQCVSVVIMSCLIRSVSIIEMRKFV